jgi:hypothetical protein
MIGPASPHGHPNRRGRPVGTGLTILQQYIKLAGTLVRSDASETEPRVVCPGSAGITPHDHRSSISTGIPINSSVPRQMKPKIVPKRQNSAEGRYPLS